MLLAGAPEPAAQLVKLGENWSTGATVTMIVLARGTAFTR